MDGEKTALVIGGGPAGLEAALKISRAGHRVVLVEKQDRLGGVLCDLCSSFPRWEDPSALLMPKIRQVKESALITVMCDTTIKAAQKQERSFRVSYQTGSGRDGHIEAHAVLLATGFDLFDASCYQEYGYGGFANVMNSLEFEAQLREWTEKGEPNPPQTVAFFKCVGSRDRSKGLPYCSKICCMYTAKQAGLVKKLFPDTKCYVFYMDYRASGKEYEEFVRSVIEDKHVRYVRGRPAKVIPRDHRLEIRVEDTLMGVPVEINADIIVLAAAIIPSRGTREMAELFQARTDPFGFLDYQGLDPVCCGDRVFMAGASGFAVDSLGAVQQGAAAAAGIIGLFRQEDQGVEECH